MELDDLKDAWRQLDQRVGALEARSLRHYERRAVDTTRKMLRGLTAGQVVPLAIAFAVVVISARFWIEHRHVPHLLLAGLAMHAYGVAWIWATVVQMLLIGRAYYTAPVVTFQRRVVELQRFRAMSTLALSVPWWILWVVATMVGAKWLVDVDLYAQSPRWIQLSIAIGVVGMILTVWLAGRLGARSASPRCRQILDDLAGHSLGRAKRSLDEIARFEQE